MKSEPGLLDTVSGFVKSTVQDFLDGQAQDMASGFIVNADESIQSSVRMDISEEEQTGAEMAQSFSDNVDGVTSSVAMIANLRNGEINPSKQVVMALISLSLKDGAINMSEILSLVPSSIADEFVSSDRLQNGQKFNFKIGDVPVSIKWHSPDSAIRQKYPKSNSGRVPTAQIRVGRHWLLTSGKWSANKKAQKSSRAHIPIIW